MNLYGTILSTYIKKEKEKRSSSDVMEGVVVTRFLLGHWQALVWIA